MSTLFGFLKRPGPFRVFLLTFFALYASIAHATAPVAVVDSQTVLASGLSQPQSVFVAASGTVYVADTNNNRIVSITAGVASTLGTPGYSLSGPSAVVVDTEGDVYIADTGNARVIEVPVSGSPAIVGASLSLEEPIALAVDASKDLYIGDGETSAIYEIPARGTAEQLDITNLTSVFPTALAADGSGNLYIADAYSNNIYELPRGEDVVSNVTPTGFTLNEPTGLAWDTAGDLYVLDTGNLRLIEVPASDSANPYQVPFTGLTSPSAVGSDAAGNLYITDYLQNTVSELLYSGNAVNLGSSTVGTPSTNGVTINYELNAPETVSAFKANSMGDIDSEITIGSGSTCTAGTYSDNPTSGGGPISADNPFICMITAEASPQFPGLRQVGLQMLGSSGSALVSASTYETGLSPEPLVFPLSATTIISGLYAPVGIVVSGANKTVYVADAGTDTPGTAHVYSWNGLTAGSPTLSMVNTSPFSLPWPTGLALDDVGDLYIADYELAEVIVVPADQTIAPYQLNTGTLLQTPIALAFDPDGNLIIADEGPDGSEATTAQPGYLVEVPRNGGAAFIMGTSPVTIVDPGGLAFGFNGDLYVTDNGAYNPDTDTYSPGDVVLVPHNGSAASVVVPALGLPSAPSVDAAGDLNVLYAYPGSITVVPPGGDEGAYSLPFSVPDDLEDAVTLAAISGGQTLLIDDDFNGNVLLLNGSQGALSFPTTELGSQSSQMAGTILNIGNSSLTLGNPAYTVAGQSAAFPIQTSTTCTNSLLLNPAATCGINAVFAPTASGSFGASVAASTNGLGSVPSFALTGAEGAGMDVIVRPNSIVDSQSGPQLRLRNGAAIHCRRCKRTS